MRTITRFFIFFFCFLAINSFGQDKHFSQFYANQIGLNPGLTGSMSGKYRMAILYRNQWQTAIDKPFKTIAGTFEMNFQTGLTSSDKVGIGVVFFSDKGGVNEFTTNSIGLSAAFHKALNLKETQYLGGGLQIGLVQRSFNFESVTFNDQFDGDGGFTFPTAEGLPTNNIGFFDLSSGVYYATSPTSRTTFNIGLGVQHANLPDVSFDTDMKDRLHTNFSFHAGAQLPAGRKMDVLPRILLYVQGPSIEVNAGATFKFVVNEFNGSSLYLGSWIRPVRDAENFFGIDAAVLLVAFEVDKVRFGASFDANTSNFKSSTSGFGAFELSIAYTGKDESKVVMCPTF